MKTKSRSALMTQVTENTQKKLPSGPSSAPTGDMLMKNPDYQSMQSEDTAYSPAGGSVWHNGRSSDLFRRADTFPALRPVANIRILSSRGGWKLQQRVLSGNHTPFPFGTVGRHLYATVHHYAAKLIKNFAPTKKILNKGHAGRRRKVRRETMRAAVRTRMPVTVQVTG